MSKERCFLYLKAVTIECLINDQRISWKLIYNEEEFLIFIKKFFKLNKMIFHEKFPDIY